MDKVHKPFTTQNFYSSESTVGGFTKSRTRFFIYFYVTVLLECESGPKGLYITSRHLFVRLVC
jgi:hypothetical protein